MEEEEAIKNKIKTKTKAKKQVEKANEQIQFSHWQFK